MSWKNATLAEVCEINPGKKELQDKSKEMEVSFLPMASVSEDGKIITQEKRKLKEVIKGYTNFRNGDVLLAKITPCFENGKRAIAKDLTNGIGFGSTEFHVLRPSREVTSDWVFHAISRSDFCNIAKSQMTGTAGQKRVPTKVLEQFRIPIPPIKEQEKISENIQTQFTRLDVVIKNLKVIQAKLELYRRSVLKSAFSNKLIHVKGNWQQFKIKEIAKKVQYGLTSQSGKNYKGPRYLRITDIQDRKVNWETVPFAKQKDDLEGYRLNKGDVVFARTGATVGKSFLIVECPRNAVFASYLIRIIPHREKILPALLWFYFQSPMYWHKISESQRGIGQPNVNGTILSNLSINLPTKIDDQEILTNEIEARFSTIDKIAEVIHMDLGKAEAFRKSILKAAFEGKLTN